MRIVILSSWVSHGHVGLSAAAPVLQALGHEVVQLPTVVLSNHPGWRHVSGAQVPVTQLEGMLAALSDNGWLAGVDALLTGYLPSAAHVDFAVHLLAQCRAAQPGLRCLVDPVLGDHPKGLYIAEPAAQALRDSLVPLADVLTPNAFELGWLTGLPCADPGDARHAALALAGAARAVYVTSPPLEDGQTGVLSMVAGESALWTVAQRPGVPHGVGDVFAALLAAGLSPGAALGHLHSLIDQSLHADHLAIAQSAAIWTQAAPLQPKGADSGL